MYSKMADNLKLIKAAFTFDSENEKQLFLIKDFEVKAPIIHNHKFNIKVYNPEEHD